MVLAAPGGLKADRVRYAWADWPVCVLRNKAGLPARIFDLPVQMNGKAKCPAVATACERTSSPGHKVLAGIAATDTRSSSKKPHRSFAASVKSMVTSSSGGRGSSSQATGSSSTSTTTTMAASSQPSTSSDSFTVFPATPETGMWLLPFLGVLAMAALMVCCCLKRRQSSRSFEKTVPRMPGVKVLSLPLTEAHPSEKASGYTSDFMFKPALNGETEAWSKKANDGRRSLEKLPLLG